MGRSPRYSRRAPPCRLCHRPSLRPSPDPSGSRTALTKQEDRPAGRSHQWLPAGLRWPQWFIRRISASRVQHCTSQESRMGMVYAGTAGSSSVCHPRKLTGGSPVLRRGRTFCACGRRPRNGGRPLKVARCPHGRRASVRRAAVTRLDGPCQSRLGRYGDREARRSAGPLALCFRGLRPCAGRSPTYWIKASAKNRQPTRT
jgi:hypothetical protein